MYVTYQENTWYCVCNIYDILLPVWVIVKLCGNKSDKLKPLFWQIYFILNNKNKLQYLTFIHLILSAQIIQANLCGNG